MSSWSSERGRCRRFTLAEMKKATDSFSGANFLGRGGEGMVFKGVLALEDGRRQVAVKRLKQQTTSGECESFEKEIKMLSKFHHANLVTLIGYCHESNEHILVYELMPNGNLRDKLNNTASPLSYEQRVLICIGAARAIEYLHTGTSLDSKIIHRDVKPDNILLTEKMEAKVSDMGLSRIISANQTHSSVKTLHLCGTPGYYAPEYYLTGKFTWRIDVYAFGVVLAEVLCKKKPPPRLGDNRHRESFSKWALRYVDPVLKGAVAQSSLEAFINTADKCLNKDPDERPSMNQVVGMLDSALKLQKYGDVGRSSKSSANGEKRQVDSESSARKSSIDFRTSKSAKFEKTPSRITISGSTCQESNVRRSTADITKPSQESKIESLGRSEVGAEDSRYSYSSGQVSIIQENSNDSNASSPTTALPDIPGTQDKVVLYYGTSGSVTDYMMIRLYLNSTFGVDIDERDPTKNEEYETELSQFFTQKQKKYSLPQLFIGGKHIGGAKDVVRLYGSGELTQCLAEYQH